MNFSIDFPTVCHYGLKFIFLISYITDPLEQFDVLSLPLPLIGGGLTNLSLLLGFNVLLMAA